MTECKHEVDLALMQQDIKNIGGNIDKITKAILGNGREGLLVRVDRIEQDISKKPSAKMLLLFSSIGGGITASLAVIAKWFCEP